MGPLSFPGVLMTRFQFMLALATPVLAAFGYRKPVNYNFSFAAIIHDNSPTGLMAQYYRKGALKRLQKMFTFREVQFSPLPAAAGRTITFKRKV